MDAFDIAVVVLAVAWIASDMAQIAYNRAVTKLLLHHGKEIDSLLAERTTPNGGEAER